MNIAESEFQLLSNIAGWGVKLGFLVMLLIYLVFAVLVVRQVELMVRTYSTPHESILKLVSWIHVGLVLLLMVAVVVL